MVKIEVMWIDLTKKEASADVLKELKSRFKDMNGWAQVFSQEVKEQDPIRDENIVDLNKDLKSQNLNAKDLFSDEEK